LTGPKSVDCNPPRNSAVSRIGRLRSSRPAAPSSMISSSSATVSVMRADFSNLSAICPAVAENRKNGRMNSACATFCSVSDDRLVNEAVW
jgi:hypothetical protein